MTNTAEKIIYFADISSIVYQGGKPKKAPTSPRATHTSVDPIKSKEHINQIIQYFMGHKDNKNHVWLRNAMIFIVGCNFSFRVSDLCVLQARHILNPDGTFKQHVLIKAKKTGKTHRIAINENVKAIVTKYYTAIGQWPEQNDFLFKSAKGSHITGDAINDIMKRTERDLGLPYNMGSHTLRKTFGYWVVQNHADKPQVLFDLQDIYGHESQRDTLRYIGLDQDVKDEIVRKLDMGIDLGLIQ